MSEDRGADRHRPLVIGLLGGIAAGKSTVAGLFAEHGFRVLDADEAARTVTAQPSVLAAIRARFGDRVFAAAGDLDRKALAAIVFADPAARADLEAITHPAVRQRLLADLRAARDALVPVLLDVPLLLEGGLIDQCDACVFLEVDAEVRRGRAEARGWSAAEWRRREASQAPLAAKRARCTFTVRNDGDLDATRAQVAEVVARLRAAD